MTMIREEKNERERIRCANMTLEQREIYLKKQRIRAQKRRANMSSKQREEYLEKQRIHAQNIRKNETPEQHEKRLEYDRIRYANETEEQYKIRMEYNKKYAKTLAGKKTSSKYHAKRKRELNYNPLNKNFNDCDAHHLDTINVINIPTKLHESYRHSLKRPKSMNKINILAWDFLESQVY